MGFIAKNKQWRTWAEFIESLYTYFLPRDFFTRLADHVRQRKQGFSESFKDYMIDMQTMVHGHLTILGKRRKGSLKRTAPQAYGFS